MVASTICWPRHDSYITQKWKTYPKYLLEFAPGGEAGFTLKVIKVTHLNLVLSAASVKMQTSKGRPPSIIWNTRGQKGTKELTQISVTDV